MKTWPNEVELLSLFETEPELLDVATKDLPFYYNEASYSFSNNDENLFVQISPAYGDVKIHTHQRSTNRLLAKLDLKQVETFEITADAENESSILLTVKDEDYLHTYEIDFKPNFKLIMQMHDLT
ncbi:hypothetical protein [Planococcus sp. YIM B11945]|uniref:hypothetical protein n=1 Tax=Planococcus sp. YIM B11945 TaxID=3435410 RepID=UPI003D7C3809